jgi:hypothetical protein
VEILSLSSVIPFFFAVSMSRSIIIGWKIVSAGKIRPEKSRRISFSFSSSLLGISKSPKKAKKADLLQILSQHEEIPVIVPITSKLILEILVSLDRENEEENEQRS